jgi:hypothetical protein
MEKKGLVKWLVVECLPSKLEALSSNLVPQKKKRKEKEARCWWLTPVILTTWEAEMKLGGSLFEAKLGK